MTIGFISSGIESIPNLSVFLGRDCRKITSYQHQQVEQLLGWGHKPSAHKIRQLAKQHHKPYIAIEDGFIRSLSPGVTGTRPHSLVVDYSGIYYNAHQSSDLEKLILAQSHTPEELGRAERVINMLIASRLSKYNTGKEEFTQSATLTKHSAVQSKKAILVIDQTKGDASVALGNADENTFQTMLDQAVEHNPGAAIYIKTHPDVVLGKKQGYLTTFSHIVSEANCVLIAEDINPWTLFDQVDKVYVVTSQLGFEALLAKKEVHCFGMPFYAGWGLTQDYQKCDRRGVSRSLIEVFLSAYIKYARYVNPYTGQACQIEDTIRLIADQRRQYKKGCGNWLAVGFSPWKKGFVADFLGPGAQVRFSKKLPLNWTGEQQNLLTWAGKINSQVKDYARTHNIKLHAMEDGFIRSVGLGVDLVKPLSLVIDSIGIYDDARSPSELEVLLNATEFTAEQVERATAIRQELITRKLSKYNVGEDTELRLPVNQTIVLVVGQVETDTSIINGSPVVKTNLELLQRARQHSPNAFLIYKPHPEVVSGARVGALNGQDATECNSPALYDLLCDDISIAPLLDQVDEVHVLTSLAGFEALLRGKKVVTHGIPFYAGWGLTEDTLPVERRGRNLTLDELVAGVLILYPTYVDLQSKEFINPETAIDLVTKMRASPKQSNIWLSLFQLFRNKFLVR